MNLKVQTGISRELEADCLRLYMQWYLPADRYLLPITSNVPRTKILHFVQNDGSGGKVIP